MDNLTEANYSCTEHCDECGSEQSGVMQHAHDAQGWATPVLWTCNRCDNPPALVKAYREAKRLVRRGKVLARYYMTPKAERLARKAKVDAMRQRIADRRLTARW